MIFLICQIIECCVVLYFIETGKIISTESSFMPDLVFEFTSEGYRDWATIIMSIKFLLFYCFMLYQIFELELMCAFILMQSSVNLNQLDIIKAKYNQFERPMPNWSKGRIIFISVGKTVLILMAFIPYFKRNFTFILMVESIIMLICFLLMLHEFMLVQWVLLKTMYT